LQNKVFTFLSLYHYAKKMQIKKNIVWNENVKIVVGEILHKKKEKKKKENVRFRTLKLVFKNPQNKTKNREKT
jgi:hypothetical protein